MRLLTACLGACFGASANVTCPVDINDVEAEKCEVKSRESDEDGAVETDDHRESQREQEKPPASPRQSDRATLAEKTLVVVDSSPQGPPGRVSLCSMKPSEPLGVSFVGGVRPELFSMLASGNSFSKLSSYHSPSVALSIADSTLSFGSGTIALMSDARVSLNGDRRGSDCGAVTVKLSTFEQLLSCINEPLWVGQGAQGAVLKGQWRSGCTVAVKLLVSDAVNVPAAYMEALLGKMLAHPYLVQTFDYAMCQLDDSFCTTTTSASNRGQGQQRNLQQPGTPCPADPRAAASEAKVRKTEPQPPHHHQQQQQQQGPAMSAGEDAAAALPKSQAHAPGQPHGTEALRVSITGPSQHPHPHPQADSRLLSGTMSAAAPGALAVAGCGAAGFSATGCAVLTAGLSGSVPTTPHGTCTPGSTSASTLLRGTYGGGGAGVGAGPEPPLTPSSHEAPLPPSAFEGVMVSADSFDGDTPAGPGVPAVDCVDVLKQLGAAPGKYVVQIVSEWCDEGTLHAAIRKGVFRPQGRRSRTWALRALLRTAREVALGMCHLHSLNIIHGDLKPGNVLLKSSRVDSRGFVAKVADFGLSRLCGRHEEYVATADWGTVPYMAGEYLDNKLCKSSDVYSFGVLLWQMYTGKAPFAGHHEAQVAVGVMMGNLQLEWPGNMPPPLLRLGQSCCRHEQEQRPTFKEVVVALAGIETQVRDAYTRTKMVRRCDSGAVGVPRPHHPHLGGPSLPSLLPGMPSMPSASGHMSHDPLMHAAAAAAAAGGGYRSPHCAAGGLMSASSQGFTPSRLLDPGVAGAALLSGVCGVGVGLGGSVGGGVAHAHSGMLSPGQPVPSTAHGSRLLCSGEVMGGVGGGPGVGGMFPSPFTGAPDSFVIGGGPTPAAAPTPVLMSAASGQLGGRGLPSTSRLQIRTSFADIAPYAPTMDGSRPGSNCVGAGGVSSAASSRARPTVSPVAPLHLFAVHGTAAVGSDAVQTGVMQQLSLEVSPTTGDIVPVAVADAAGPLTSTPIRNADPSPSANMLQPASAAAVTACGDRADWPYLHNGATCQNLHGGSSVRASGSVPQTGEVELDPTSEGPAPSSGHTSTMQIDARRSLPVMQCQGPPPPLPPLGTQAAAAAAAAAAVLSGHYLAPLPLLRQQPTGGGGGRGAPCESPAGRGVVAGSDAVGAGEGVEGGAEIGPVLSMSVPSSPFPASPAAPEAVAMSNFAFAQQPFFPLMPQSQHVPAQVNPYLHYPQVYAPAGLSPRASMGSPAAAVFVGGAGAHGDLRIPTPGSQSQQLDSMQASPNAPLLRLYSLTNVVLPPAPSARNHGSAPVSMMLSPGHCVLPPFPPPLQPPSQGAAAQCTQSPQVSIRTGSDVAGALADTNTTGSTSAHQQCGAIPSGALGTESGLPGGFTAASSGAVWPSGAWYPYLPCMPQHGVLQPGAGDAAVSGVSPNFRAANPQGQQQQTQQQQGQLNPGVTGARAYQPTPWLLDAIMSGSTNPRESPAGMMLGANAGSGWRGPGGSGGGAVEPSPFPASASRSRLREEGSGDVPLPANGAGSANGSGCFTAASPADGPSGSVLVAAAALASGSLPPMGFSGPVTPGRRPRSNRGGLMPMVAGGSGMSLGAGPGAGVLGMAGGCSLGSSGRRSGTGLHLLQGHSGGYGAGQGQPDGGREGFASMMVIPLAPLQEDAVEGPNSTADG